MYEKRMYDQKQLFAEVSEVRVLKNFADRKTPTWESPFSQSSRPCNFIRKRFRHRRFPVKFVKLLRTPFLAYTISKNS